MRREITSSYLLLVDDSKTMRLLMRRAVRQAGYRELLVCVAENGFIGFEKVNTEKPRLIISDWLMPQLSG